MPKNSRRAMKSIWKKLFGQSRSPYQERPHSRRGKRRSYPLLEQLEDRTLLDAQPVVTLAVPAENFLGEDFTFQATFDNQPDADPGSDVGYGPYLDLFFPVNGADGAAGTSAPDGIDFQSASYLGASLNTIQLTFPDDDGAGPGTTGTINHPFAVNPDGTPIQMVGTAGDKLVVLELPFGSVTPQQPEITVDVNASLSNLADLASFTGFDPANYTITAGGGFRFGRDPLNNPSTDNPVFAPQVTANMDPVLMTLTKVNNAPESETATGPNYVRSYTITVDIADGQTIDNLDVIDLLDNNIVYQGNVSITGNAAGVNNFSLVEPASTTQPLNNSQFIATFNSVTGTAASEDIVVSFDFYVAEFDADALPVIPVFPSVIQGEDDLNDPTMPAASITENDTRAIGDWDPVDLRDPQGQTDNAIADPDPSGPEDVLDDKSIAIQKSVAVVGGGAVVPGAVLQYTLNFQISDFYTFGDLIITDTFQDGQLFDFGTPATFNITDGFGGNVANGFLVEDITAPVANATLTVDQTRVDRGDDAAEDPASDGATDLTFRVSQAMVDQGGAADGILQGGLTDGPTNRGAATGVIRFYTIVQQDFADTFPSGDRSVDQGDIISNNDVNISGSVRLNAEDGNINVSVHAESDDSSAGVVLEPGVLLKTLYAHNGDTNLPPGFLQIAPGDTVTYSLEYTLPTSDFEDLVLTDYLPLPVFFADDPDANPGTPFTGWTFLAEATNPERVSPPSVGQVHLGPNDTFFDSSPGSSDYFTSSDIATPGGNGVSFTFGDYDDPNDPNTTIQLLFTVQASDEPFADGLFLTNIVRVNEGTTNAGNAIQDQIVQIELTEPELEITKGVVATDANTTGTFSPNTGPAGITFVDAGSAGAPFVGGTISSQSLRSQTISDVQVGFTSPPTGGTFTLSFSDGATTATTSALPFNATAAAVQAALLALANVGPGEISVSGGPANSGTPFQIQFSGILAGSSADQLGGDAGNLSNGQITITDNFNLPARDQGIDSNLSNVDQADVVRFAILVENTGRSRRGVFDIQIHDVLAPGYEFVPGSIQIVDGTGAAISFVNVDPTNPGLFGAGIELMDPGPTPGTPDPEGRNAGAIDEFDPLDGQNIALIFYDVILDQSTTLSFGSDPVSGDFTLTFDDGVSTDTTAAIPFDASASGVQAALESLSNINAGDVFVTGGPVGTATPFIIHFRNGLQGTPASSLTLNSNALLDNGGNNVAINIADDFLEPETQINVATVTNYAGVEGGPDYPDITDQATVTVTRPTSTKSLIDTEIANTTTVSGQQTAVIGEVLSYDVVINIPEGVTRGFTVTDTLDQGLAFMDSQQLAFSALPASGTFDLTFDDGNGPQNATFNFDVTAANIQAVMETFAGVNAGDIVVTGGPADSGTPFVFHFLNGLMGMDSDNLSVDTTNLQDSGGGAITDSVNEVNIINATIQASAGLSSSTGSFVDILNNALVTRNNGQPNNGSVNDGRRVEFDFGTLTNPDTDNATTETITITYTAIVVNSTNNDASDQRNNLVQVDWTENTGAPTQDSAPNVRILEPLLTVDKTVNPGQADAGNTVTFTVTITNETDTNFRTDAFEVNLTDLIPADTTFAGNLTHVGGVVPTSLSEAGGIVTAFWNVLGRGQSSTFSFDVTIDGSASPPGLTNTVDIDWSSLAGDETSARSGFNDFSVERTGNPADPAQNPADNDYNDSDDAFLQIVVVPTKQITATSEAHTTDASADTFADPRPLAVGEIAEFQLDAVIPEGTSTNFVWSDFLSDGLQLLPNSLEFTITSDVVMSTPVDLAAANFATIAFPAGRINTNDDVVQIDINGTPTAGSFTLTFDDGVTSDTTSAIAFNATAANVQSALEGLSNINPGEVQVVGGPAGTSPPLRIVFLAGLAGSDSTNLSFADSLTGATITGLSDYQRIDFDFGTIVNNDNDANAESMTLGYDVLVTNTGNNNDGDIKTNDFLVFENGTQVANSNAVHAEAVEPLINDVNLQVVGGDTTRDAGVTVPFEVTFSNTGSTTGFDVRLFDDLPADLDNLANIRVFRNSVEIFTGFTNNSDLDTLDLIFDQIAVGDNIRVEFTADLSTTVNPGATINTDAFVNYTSLPGPLGTQGNPTGSNVSGISGSSTGERNGPLTTSVIDHNDYHDEDPASLTINSNSITGYVYRDNDDDGDRELGAGETGINGVLIQLTGTDHLGNTINETTSTDANGFYRFDTLRPGNYTVTEVVQPVGFFDGIDTAGTPFGGDATTTNDVIAAITIPPDSNTTGIEYNFGELAPSSLSGFVYEDLDNDGVFDTGEPAIQGAQISLTGVDHLGNTVNLTTTTDSNGFYQFTTLRPSNAAGYTLTEVSVPPGYLDGRDTIGTQGGDDSNNDQFTSIVLNAGVDGLNNNFGELPPSSVSGSVFIDRDNDGVIDGGEPGIVGVTVTLTGTDDLGNPVNLVATTDGNGDYSFTNLRPGTYTITETQPGGFLDGRDSTGDTGGTLTDDQVSNFVLDPGENNTEVNFGELEPASISGSVYVDTNNDGIRQPSEDGIGGAVSGGTTITLTGTDDLGNSINLTTNTDGNGDYSFGNLRPGVYTVTETQPNGFGDGLDRVGSLGGNGAVNDQVSNINVNSGDAGINYDFGELGPLVEDVTDRVETHRCGALYNWWTGQFHDLMTITNTSATAINGSIQVVLRNLTPGVTLANATGTTPEGDPFIVIDIASLAPGESINVPLVFNNPMWRLIDFTPQVYSGNF